MAGENGPVEVRISCQCPGTPHEQDTVWLRPKPDLTMGLAVREAIRQSGSLRGDARAAVQSVIVRYGVVAWTCRGDDGPIDVTTDNVALRLGWGDDALDVVNAARDLYEDAVLAPLAQARNASPTPSPTTPSTSQNPASGRHTRSSSGPSSRSAAAAGTTSATTGE